MQLAIIAMVVQSMKGQLTKPMVIYVPQAIFANLEVMHQMLVGLVNLQGGMVMTIAMHVYLVSSFYILFMCWFILTFIFSLVNSLLQLSIDKQYLFEWFHWQYH